MTYVSTCPFTFAVAYDQGFFLCISTRSPPEGLQRFLELANLVHELGANGT